MLCSVLFWLGSVLLPVGMLMICEVDVVILCMDIQSIVSILSNSLTQFLFIFLCFLLGS